MYIFDNAIQFPIEAVSSKHFFKYWIQIEQKTFLLISLTNACIRQKLTEKKILMNREFEFTSKLISCSKTSPLGVTNGTLSNLEKNKIVNSILHTMLCK